MYHYYVEFDDGYINRSVFFSSLKAASRYVYSLRRLKPHAQNVKIKTI